VPRGVPKESEDGLLQRGESPRAFEGRFRRSRQFLRALKEVFRKVFVWEGLGWRYFTMKMGWELCHCDFFVRIIVINLLPIVSDDGYMR
jgi:hypothetical protein